jgi:hypothetical protein
MLKRSIFLVATLFLTYSAFSQVGLGIKGGVNFANANVDNADSRTGYHAGIFVPIRFAGGIGIQPEALYSSQGTDIQDFGEYEFNYINIPVLLTYSFLKVLEVQAGPQFGILMNSELEGVDIKDATKSSDISIAVGAEVNLPFGLTGGLRYNIGITDLVDDPNGFVNVSPGLQVEIDEFNNRVFQIYVGYRLFGK